MRRDKVRREKKKEEARGKEEIPTTDNANGSAERKVRGTEGRNKKRPTDATTKSC